MWAMRAPVMMSGNTPCVIRQVCSIIERKERDVVGKCQQLLQKCQLMTNGL